MSEPGWQWASAARLLLTHTFIGDENSRIAASRGRTAVLNQLLLCLIVVVVSLIVIFTSTSFDSGLFLVGAAIVMAGGAVTILVPWSRIPRGWVFLVPLADVAGIVLVRIAEPFGGLGLLLCFPAMWLAALGTVGFILQFFVITGAYWWVVAAAPTPQTVYSVVVLPAVVLAIATTIFFSTRRYLAQQTLLDNQATMLTGALARAQRQEELTTEVLDAVDFGVLRIAPDGSVAVVNEALGRFQSTIPGFGRPDLHVDNAYRIDGKTPLPVEERPLLRAVRGEVFDNQVIWYGHPDERRTAISVTVRRMADTYGADAGAVLIARDVTAELTALRARDQLVASVSHELRTPLTSVLGYIDLAVDNLDRPEQARKDLEIAGRNSERLLEIVSDILAASSSSRLSVDMTISPEDVDVAAIVRAAAEAWRPRAALNALTVTESGIEPARAFADPLRLRQVVDNLVSNAVKYNRDGGEVAIGCASDDTTTWILVRDTGSGISDADQPRLFDRYFRARSDVDGTGLGLSISREIVRAHGGDIIVRSAKGAGSTFIVSLPVHPVDTAHPASALTVEEQAS